jgi:uncharacterized protein (TIGR02996 family)
VSSPLATQLLAVLERYPFEPAEARASLQPLDHLPRVRAIRERLASREGGRATVKSPKKPIPNDAELDEAAHAILLRLELRLGLLGEGAAAREDALLQRIYDAPRDDAPRAVYADWLSELGDPRGEFITLSLARRSVSRMKALLKLHKRLWLVADKLAHLRTVSFDRGFVVAGRGQLEAEGAFSTLEQLESLDDRPFALDVTAGRWLRRVAPLDWSTLARLGHSGVPLALEHVGVECFPAPTQADLDAVVAGPGLPSLARIDVVSPHTDQRREQPVFEAVLSRGRPTLRAFGVRCTEDQISDWARWFEGEPRVQELHLGLGRSWLRYPEPPLLVLER